MKLRFSFDRQMMSLESLRGYILIGLINSQPHVFSMMLSISEPIKLRVPSTNELAYPGVTVTSFFF